MFLAVILSIIMLMLMIHFLPVPSCDAPKFSLVWLTFIVLLLYSRSYIMLWKKNKDYYDKIPAFKEFRDSALVQ